MILFLSDWLKHPGACIQDNTKNTSWIRAAAAMRRMGVKNHLFHLSLLNPALKEIDPYSPNLTKVEMAMVRAECEVNPWYFLREVARIKPQAGRVPNPVRANRGNLALWWLYFNHITVLLMQIRQTGKSVSTDKLLEWILDFGAYNVEIGLLTKDDDLRTTNVRRIKESRKYVPAYLYTVTKADSDNTFEVTNKSRGNVIKTFVGQKDKGQANNRGRGMTVPTIWGDEGPFTPNVDITISAMLGATGAVRKEAEQNGQPYGNIFTTTAGDRYTREGAFMYNLFQGSLGWNEGLLDCADARELEERVRVGSIPPYENVKTLKAVSCVFNHLQLGLTDDDLIQILENVTGTPDEIGKDFFNQWGNGGATNPIPKDILTVLVASEMEPRHTELVSNMYTIFWFVNDPRAYVREHHCVAGIDTSDGVGRDANVMVIRCVDTMAVIGVLRVNETNTLRFINFVGQFALQFQNITFIPERRSTGATLIDGLILAFVKHRVNPFKRIFNTLVNEANTTEGYAELLRGTERCLDWQLEEFDKYKKYFGYATAGTGEYSRNALYSHTLIQALKLSANGVRDKYLINEITGLEEKNGRIDHRSGLHDDMVVSWMLSAWLLLHGNNLRYYDIINPMNRITPVGEEKRSAEEIYVQRMTNESIYKQIETLLADMRYVDDPIVKQQMIVKVNTLKEKLTDEEKILSVDTMYQSFKEEKKNRFLTNYLKPRKMADIHNAAQHLEGYTIY